AVVAIRRAYPVCHIRHCSHTGRTGRPPWLQIDASPGGDPRTPDGATPAAQVGLRGCRSMPARGATPGPPTEPHRPHRSASVAADRCQPGGRPPDPRRSHTGRTGRSVAPLLKHGEVPDGVPVVLPLLLEDYLQ